MTNEDATKLMKKWVDIIGLHDWEIQLAWQCKPEEVPEHDCDGYTIFDETTKTALVYIVDEKYIDCSPFTHDFEVTLVHELMHLKTAILTDRNCDSLQNRMMHCLVEDMAKALVKAKRMLPEMFMGGEAV